MKTISLWKILDNTQKELVGVVESENENFIKKFTELLKDTYSLDLIDRESNLYYGLGGLYNLEVK